MRQPLWILGAWFFDQLDPVLVRVVAFAELTAEDTSHRREDRSAVATRQTVRRPLTRHADNGPRIETLRP
jgi:hypothetical protein